MQWESSPQQRVEAAAEIDQGESRKDGAKIADSLTLGLALLRDSLLDRIHQDVEDFYGEDSMLAPVSLVRSEHETGVEIQLYEIAESVVEVQTGRYVRRGHKWFMEWLAKMTFGDAAQEPRLHERLAHYAAQSPDQRRLAFSNVLVKAMPVAGRAPLITFSLFPLAAAIATAIAFGDVRRATELRNAQAAMLPAIFDCQRCHGRPLANGDHCELCGNPLWKYEWLTSAD